MTSEEYQKIRSRIEKLSRQRDETNGSLKAIMNSIKKEFGCKTLDEAFSLLEKLKQEVDDKSEELDEKEAAFRKKWKEYLGG